MTTINKQTIKKQAKSLLKQMIEKTHVNYGTHMESKNFILSSQLLSLEKQLDEELLVLKPQAISIDGFTEFISQFKDLLLNCDINQKDMISKIEGFAIFACQLSRCKGLVDVSLALTSLIHRLFGISVSEVCTKIIIDKFYKIIAEDSDELHTQSLEEFLDSTCANLDFLQNMSKLPVLEKFHKFFMYLLSYSILDSVGLTFENLGYNHFERVAITRAHSSNMGFWYCLLDSMLLFCRQFVKSVKLGSFEPFLHSPSSYDEWIVLVFKLKRQEKFISNPAPHDFDIFTFRSELDEALTQGRAIVKMQTVASKFEKDRLRALLCDLELIKANDITKKSAQRDRDAPFSILLAGGSSVGKSHLTNILFQYFANLFDLPSGSEFKYTRNFTEEFWNGFNSSQWFIILDDIAALSPSLGSLDPSLAEVINVVNNVAFVPNQADLADKGKTPCLAQLVVATTNTPDLNAYAYFSCPLAIQRRIPWVVRVEPKEEYSRNKVMLDPSKCIGEPQKFDDFWKITVDKIVPASDNVLKQRAKMETVQVFTSIIDFLQWFGKTAITHRQQQTSLASAEVEMKKIVICKNIDCLLPTYACKCYDEQSLAENNVYTFNLCTNFINYVILGIGMWYWHAILSPCISFFHTYIDTQRRLSKYLNVWSSFIYYCVMRYVCYRISTRFQERVKDIGIYTKIFGLAVGIVTMYVTIAPLFKKDKEAELAPQVGVYAPVEDIGTRPQPRQEERTNVWYKNDFVTTTFDVSPQVLSWKGLPQQKVEDMILRNCLRFKLDWGGGHWKNTGAFAIGCSLYVVNTHAIPDLTTFALTILRDVSKDGVNGNVTVTIHKSQIFKIDGTDITFLHIKNIPPHKDLSDLLVSTSLQGKFVGKYCSFTKNATFKTNIVRHISSTQYDWGMGLKTHWMGVSQELTQDGDCGSVLLAFAPLGPIIFGIHSLGNSHSEVVAAPIYKYMYEAALQHFDAWRIQSGSPSLGAEGVAERSISALSERSPFRYIDTGSAAIYGSLNGNRIMPKSSVIRTIMSDRLEQEGYVQKYDKPCMRGWLPWRIAALDMVNIPMGFDQSIIDICVSNFTDDIIKSLGDQIKEIQVYDLFTSINGASGVAYVDKMNRNTSAGFPWCKSKKFYLHAIAAVDGLPDPVDITDDMKCRIQNCIDTYIDGRRYMPVFTGHLKDEPTKYSKIASGKTRVFGGAPMDWSLVVRMHLLSVIRLVQNNKYIFESAPGTIAQSKEWGDIYKYLVHFSESRIVAGDYAAFDKSMPSNIILAAYQIIYNLCKTAGYSQEALSVVQGIGVDTAFPLFNFNGDLAAFFGSNPSGHPLTVIVNGLANAIYMRYCYYLLNPNHEIGSFKQNVHLMTYGDDNVMGVSVLADWFNHTSIQNVLKGYGVKYTMADKESESVPFIHIKDVSFLKRCWIWNEDVDAYLCPLEHDSIEKSLMTCVASKSVTSEYQSVAIMSTASQEYFFYGKNIFHTKRELFLSVCEELDLMHYVQSSTFPLWEELVERFHAHKCNLLWS